MVTPQLGAWKRQDEFDDDRSQMTFGCGSGQSMRLWRSHLQDADKRFRIHLTCPAANA
jgi:hypothetical protein